MFSHVQTRPYRIMRKYLSYSCIAKLTQPDIYRKAFKMRNGWRSYSGLCAHGAPISYLSGALLTAEQYVQYLERARIFKSIAASLLLLSLQGILFQLLLRFNWVMFFWLCFSFFKLHSISCWNRIILLL